MREIKFRAWIDGRGWIEFRLGDLAHNTDDGLWNLEGWTEVVSWDDVKHICQFTGLKDKNGKEIYEGDIVEYEEPSFESEVLRSPVIFIAGAFGLDGTNGHFNPSFYRLGKFAKNDLEVLGNIYENPELLK